MFGGAPGDDIAPCKYGVNLAVSEVQQAVGVDARREGLGHELVEG